MFLLRNAYKVLQLHIVYIKVMVKEANTLVYEKYIVYYDFLVIASY